MKTDGYRIPLHVVMSLIKVYLYFLLDYDEVDIF